MKATILLLTCLSISATVSLTGASSAQAMESQLEQCFELASDMSTERGAENARVQCLNRFQQSISVDDCREAADEMESDRNKDAVRMTCAHKSTSADECQDIAGSMEEDFNKDAALRICVSKLGR